jgi:excisionase family DNA binding protein
VPPRPTQRESRIAGRLLSIQEAAERLNVSPWRAYDLARQGLLPVVRLGRSLRVSETVLEQFIADGGRALPGGWKREP